MADRAYRGLGMCVLISNPWGLVYSSYINYRAITAHHSSKGKQRRKNQRIKLSPMSVYFELYFFPEHLISDSYDTINIRKMVPDNIETCEHTPH